MSVVCQFGSGTQIAVGPLPGRRRICLYTVRGSVLEVLAYFTSEAAADAYCRLMWNRTYPGCEVASTDPEGGEPTKETT